MTLLLLTTEGPIWPYSPAQLRADNPRLSLSAELPDRELASLATLDPPVLVVRPVPTSRPEYDPATEKVVEVRPVEVDGIWRQAWEVLPLTQEELDAIYQSQHPPEWVGFYAALNADPQIGVAVEQVLRDLLPPSPAANLRALGGLYVGLGQAASGGDSRVFLQTWQLAAAGGLLTPEIIAGVQAMATAFNLPAEFIAGLQPPTEEPPE